MNNIDRKVVLSRPGTYEQQVLLEHIDQAMGLLLERGTLRGCRVLLKPNLISATAPSWACTHPFFIAAVARWFVDHGAKVCLGDSPALGTARRVCQRLGLIEILAEFDIPIIEFGETTSRVLRGGQRLRIARAALECDLLVGLPKLKAHKQMFVTMAVKNLFGCVQGIQKAMLHMTEGRDHRHFAKLLLDLVTQLPPQIHLVDGLEAMHRSGPLDGEKHVVHCMAAGSNPVAVDRALLAALELEVSRCPISLQAEEWGVPGAILEELVFPGLHPESFAGTGFLAPEELIPVRFSPFRLVNSLGKRLTALVQG